jgi:hypothetical protein
MPGDVRRYLLAHDRVLSFSLGKRKRYPPAASA